MFHTHAHPTPRARPPHSQVGYTNKGRNGIGHDIDFHAVNGPGGDAPALLAEQGETRVGIFKMVTPGLFVYHCAAAPVPVSVAQGMCGLVLVEPAGGLPPVDRECSVMQSDCHTVDTV